MNIVLCRSRNSSAWRIIAGWVVSRTCIPLTPNVRFSTSGASDEPPMPSSTNASKRVRASPANCRNSPIRSCIRFGSSSHPSHLSSSAPVQTVASRPQMRSTSSCCAATLTPPPPKAPAFRFGSCRRQLAALRLDAVHQLAERVGELLHPFALERVAANRLEPLVRLGIDARDEEARDRVHGRWIAAVLHEPLDSADVRLHHRLVPLEREDQRHVDVAAGGDHLLDRAESRLGSRN